MKGLEGTGYPGYPFIDLRRDPVDRDLEIPGGIALKQTDLVLGDSTGVGKDRNQEPFFFQGAIDFGKVGPEQGLTPGDQAPQGPQGKGLIGQVVNFLKGKLLVPGLEIMGRKVDVAMAAVIIAAGGKLQLKE